jgi:hypothetical protein
MLKYFIQPALAVLLATQAWVAAGATTTPQPGKPGKARVKTAATSAMQGENAAPTPAQDKKGSTPPEYKRPNRWGLTAGASQRHDWLTGKNRFELHEHINAKKVLGMPEWLEGSLEQRTRYETFDTPW